MKKSPWARLITSSNPKIMDNPNAISAMMSPKTRPFMARTAMVLLMMMRD
jgi:hypothetical protein